MHVLEKKISCTDNELIDLLSRLNDRRRQEDLHVATPGGKGPDLISCDQATDRCGWGVSASDPLASKNMVGDGHLPARSHAPGPAYVAAN